MEWLVFVAFNVPIILALLVVARMALEGKLTAALTEKSATAVDSGDGVGAISYSRITGFLGAAAVTSFFWALGNLIIIIALSKKADPAIDIYNMINGTTRYFLIGSALFLPYAFNQLKSVFAAEDAKENGAGQGGAHKKKAPDTVAGGAQPDTTAGATDTLTGGTVSGSQD